MDADHRGGTNAVTWQEAADLLRQYLEDSARIVEEASTHELPPIPAFELEGIPDPETEARIRSMLADANDAMEALALRKAEITQEIEHMNRLRTAGAGYLRNAG